MKNKKKTLFTKFRMNQNSTFIKFFKFQFSEHFYRQNILARKKLKIHLTFIFDMKKKFNFHLFDAEAQLQLNA